MLPTPSTIKFIQTKSFDIYIYIYIHTHTSHTYQNLTLNDP